MDHITCNVTNKEVPMFVKLLHLHFSLICMAQSFITTTEKKNKHAFCLGQVLMQKELS